MLKNKGKGSKMKIENECKKKLELKRGDKPEVYAQVVKMLGDCYLEAKCFDGVTRRCHISNQLRKKVCLDDQLSLRVCIEATDIILVGLYDIDKPSVILRYNAEEARQLKEYGELPDHVCINKSTSTWNRNIRFFCHKVNDCVKKAPSEAPALK